MPHFATFEIDRLHCGLDVRLVQEVLRDQPVTPVPRAKPDVRGLVNLRGQILVAIDLRQTLGRGVSPQPDPERLPSVLILQTEHEPIALVVDALGDVESPPDALYEPCRGLLADPFDDLITGAYRQDNRLLHVLDPIALAGRLLAA